eukprot:TRINITY_DN8000_c0_g1_i1.p1 TRINITY_DN8000_c0_g1~~TRINITY_DN8000_c0_g1_i1.p1  ORF type:complete len:940 (+),score=145.83 TRINITY_DN8000_c0_g1_i1:237-2822(+)
MPWRASWGPYLSTVVYRDHRDGIDYVPLSAVLHLVCTTVGLEPDREGKATPQRQTALAWHSFLLSGQFLSQCLLNGLFLHSTVPNDTAGVGVSSAPESELAGAATDAALLTPDLGVLQASAVEETPPRIPHAIRGNAWQHTMNSHKRMLKNPGVFEALLDEPLLGTVKQQIDMDVSRTLSNFSQTLSTHLSSYAPQHTLQLQTERMQRVLCAYANYNKHIGYCQGMTYIVSMCVLHMDSESAFWFLVSLIEQKNLEKLFDPAISGIVQDSVIFEELLRNTVPLISEHFRSLSVEPLNYLPQWFMSLMTVNVPSWPVMLRIWDHLVVEGIDTVFSASLAIIKTLEADLLAFPDAENLIPYLLKIPSDRLQYGAVIPLMRHFLRTLQIESLRNPAVVVDSRFQKQGALIDVSAGLDAGRECYVVLEGEQRILRIFPNKEMFVASELPSIILPLSECLLVAQQGSLTLALTSSSAVITLQARRSEDYDSWLSHLTPHCLGDEIRSEDKRRDSIQSDTDSVLSAQAIPSSPKSSVLLISSLSSPIIENYSRRPSLPGPQRPLFSRNIDSEIERHVQILIGLDGGSIGGGAWEFVREKDSVRVWKRDTHNSSFHCVKGVGIIPVPCISVLDMVADLTYRGRYDPLLHSSHVVETISPSTTVTYLAYQMRRCLAKGRDFCVVSHWRGLGRRDLADTPSTPSSVLSSAADQLPTPEMRALSAGGESPLPEIRSNSPAASVSDSPAEHRLSLSSSASTHRDSTDLQPTEAEWSAPSMQLRGESANGPFVALGFSTEHASCPPTDAFVRGEVIVSGWILRPIERGTWTLVTHLCQVDLRGTLPTAVTNSVAEMQPQCVSRLRRLLAPQGT